MKRVTMIFVLLVFTVTLFAQNQFEEALVISQGFNLDWSKASSVIDEGVVYVWSDTREGDKDLYAQLISPTGEKRWGENGIVVDNNIDRQEDAIIVTSIDNSVIIGYKCYADNRIGVLKAQKISSSGEKLWGENGISLSAENTNPNEISLSPDNNGGVYFVWNDDFTTYGKIYAQHIDSTGLLSFEENGMELGDLNCISKIIICSDQQGGLFVSYKTDEPGVGVCLRYLRLTVEDGIVWDSFINNEGLNNYLNWDVIYDGLEGFIIACGEQTTDYNIYYLRLHKIGLDGEYLWSEDGIIVGESEFYANKPNLLISSDNKIIVSWERQIVTDRTIYFQKLDLSGNIQWPIGGIASTISEYEQYKPSIIPNNQGGVVLCWYDYRDGIAIYMQNINTDGTLTWEENGRLFTEIYDYYATFTFNNFGNVYNLQWLDYNQNDLNLKSQLIDNSGNNLLEDDGITVTGGNNANIKTFKSFNYEGNTIIIWEEDSIIQKKLKYQIIDNQGNELLPHNGEDIGMYSYGFDAEINSQGEVCIAWYKIEEDLLVPYAQIINNQGEKMLEQEGLLLRENASSRNIIIVNYRNNGWEIFWTENFELVWGIMGQRIENYQEVWGSSGKEILHIFDDFTFDGVNTVVTNAFSDYLLYAYHYDMYVNYKLLKINTEGEIIEDWLPSGKPVYENAANQILANAIINDEKIYVIWAEQSTELSLCYYAAILDLNGEPINDDYVYNLTPFDNEQTEAQVMIQNSFLYVSYVDNNNIVSGYNKVVLQKYSLEDNAITPLWDGLGKVVFVDEAHHFQPSMIPMDSRILIASQKSLFSYYDYESDFDIYMNMLDSNGNILGSSEGYLVNNHIKYQVEPQIIKNSPTTVSVIWKDGISSGKQLIYSLYMQKVSTDIFTSIDDDVETTPTPFKSLGNYPNPFNPETKIAFNMKYASNVKIDIYNVKGQKVKTLIDEFMDKGNHNILWNGVDNKNNPVSSGIYLYKISTEEHSATHKMLLLK